MTVSEKFLYFIAFMGVMLLLSSLTGYCPMMMLLSKFGFKSGIKQEEKAEVETEVNSEIENNI